MAAKRFKQIGGLNAHVMVAQMAQEMAQELFEVYASDNEIYRNLRANGQVTEKAAREFFVIKMTPKLLEDARIALTSCLGGELPKYQQDKIAEALIRDNQLRANRQVSSAAAILPAHLH